MFEKYTERARRVIFFGRYEASQYGSPYIETEHLLLGLLREDKALANRFLRSHGSIESIRKEIESRITVRDHGHCPYFASEASSMSTIRTGRSGLYCCGDSRW